MEVSPHSLLVGSGADIFAAAQGFEQEVSGTLFLSVVFDGKLAICSRDLDGIART
jgi:hypothetical protein